MPGGIIVGCATITLVLLAIGVHYEALRFATFACGKFPLVRVRVALAIVVATFAHVVEAFVFAVGIYLLVRFDVGTVVGADNFGELVYFSLATYSSLGYGDLVPGGPIRIMAGVEAIMGLVLIAWTASFTYYEMRRYWRD